MLSGSGALTTPSGNAGEDRAGAFFVSDDAAYVTGQTISVYGGQWMLG
jgi:NAD(P)-dependent dehydrogenase (short-subunit alcohol dehydrogenase family)